MNFSKGAVSLVTGGASGLGKAVVERLAQQGSNVVLCDLPASKGSELAKEIGKNVLFAPVNVSSNGMQIATSKPALRSLRKQTCKQLWT